MNRITFLTPILPLLSLTTHEAVRAQQPAPATPIPVATVAPSRPAFGPGPFRVPIHTMTRDDAFGDYGLWASGDDYKVSFHDGFVFYPVLGKHAPENLPLRWATLSVAVGGEPIADVGALERTHTDWRCEYRYGTVTEVYDVLPHGVEQTFVVAQRPAAHGDLVIEGAVTTKLTARPAAAAVQDLEFSDGDGTVRVRYGRGTAIAADGARVAATTQWDGSRVRIVVPGLWLATAAFPVVVDPLTTANPYASGLGSDPASVSVHHQDESVGHDTAVAFVRASSGFDYDLFVRTGTADVVTGSPVFSDVAAGWSSLTPDVSYIAGADRWIVGFERQFASDDRVRVYFHDRDNLMLNSGVVDSSYNPTGEHASVPVVGGTSHPTLGTRGVLVYRMDPVQINSSTSQLHALVVDAGTRAFGPRVVVEGAMDVENADVTCQIGWGDDGWIVVYPGRTSATDDYDVYARRLAVEPSLAVTAPFLVGPDDLGDKGNPAVAGQEGRYAVAMIQDGVFDFAGTMHGRKVLVARLDWNSMTSSRSTQLHRIAATSAQMDLIAPALAYDTTTRSHWCLLYDSNTFLTPVVQCRRLGHTGGVVESVTIGSPRYGSAAAWDPDTNRFVVMSCSAEQSSVLYGQQLAYPPSAANTPFGTPCGPAIATSDTLPIAGHEFYGVRLFGAPPGQIGALCYSTGAGSTPLAAIGAPGCTMLLAGIDVMLPIVTDSGGEASYSLHLPDAPAYYGDLYWQYVYLWPAAPTPFQIGATNGLRSRVR